MLILWNARVCVHLNSCSSRVGIVGVRNMDSSSGSSNRIFSGWRVPTCIMALCKEGGVLPREAPHRHTTDTNGVAAAAPMRGASSDRESFNTA